MRIFALCFTFLCCAPFAVERASLGISTIPEDAKVFLDNSEEPEPDGTPYENPAMLLGEHLVMLAPPSESFVPAFYDFALQPAKHFEIRHEFLRRNQVHNAYSLSPSEFHIEANFGFSHFHGFDSNSVSKIPLDFRLGLPHSFEARLKIPVQEYDVKEFALGMQYNYFPLQAAIALDWFSPRSSGYSAIRAAILAEQNAWILNLLENVVYEFSKQNKAEFYLRAGVPVKRVFLPYLGLREKITLPLKSHLFFAEPGALLQASNNISLEIAVPLAFVGKNANKGFGFYFGIHADFSFDKKTAKNKGMANIIWDVNEVSNKEYGIFCEETGREIPAEAKEHEDYPVLGVSLKDALEYATWARKRLPTAVEWKALASSYSSFEEFCETPKLKKVHEGKIVNGVRNFAGNAAIWLYPENNNSSLASFAGSSYGEQPETCRRKANLTDISLPEGNKFIGIRLVKDL